MAQKYAKLPAFYRGDTPLLVIPALINNVAADITGYSGFLTFNATQYPLDNTSAFLHRTMTTSTGDALGLGYTNYFYYQFTNTDTELFDPTVTYYWDVQINKSPANTNNFTIAAGTFTPNGDISRGLV